MKERKNSKKRTTLPNLKALAQKLKKPKPKNLKLTQKKKKDKENKELKKRHFLRNAMLKAGIEIAPEVFSKWIFRISATLTGFIVLYIFQIYFSYFKFSLVWYMPFILIAGILGFFMFAYFACWLGLYLAFDVISYKRTALIEEVLPDFLLLMSANVRSGMPIDRAMWYAVRPRFGVLAKEIETTAKETMSGEDLEVALRNLGSKYNSRTLKNTINLLIEGINAGGEIGELLNKISVGIQDTRLLKKEMAAGISAYAIFIGISALVVAPVMFALSSQLLVVISEVTSSIDISAVGSASMAFTPGQIGVTQKDFLIFAYTNLFLTSLMSAMIVSIIKKGEIKAGAKMIPIFVATSMLIFYASYTLFSGVFGGII